MVIKNQLQETGLLVFSWDPATLHWKGFHLELLVTGFTACPWCRFHNMVLWGMFLVMSPWSIYILSLQRKQKHSHDSSEAKTRLVLEEYLTTGHQNCGPPCLVIASFRLEKISKTTKSKWPFATVPSYLIVTILNWQLGYIASKSKAWEQLLYSNCSWGLPLLKNRNIAQMSWLPFQKYKNLHRTPTQKGSLCDLIRIS